MSSETQTEGYQPITKLRDLNIDPNEIRSKYPEIEKTRPLPEILQEAESRNEYICVAWIPPNAVHRSILLSAKDDSFHRICTGYPDATLHFVPAELNTPESNIQFINLDNPPPADQMSVYAIDLELNAREMPRPTRWFFYALPERQKYLSRARNGEIQKIQKQELLPNDPNSESEGKELITQKQDQESRSIKAILEKTDA